MLFIMALINVLGMRARANKLINKKKLKYLYVVFISLFFFLIIIVLSMPMRRQAKQLQEKPDMFFVNPEILDHQSGKEVFYLIAKKAELYRKKDLMVFDSVTIDSKVSFNTINIYAENGSYRMKENLIKLQNNFFEVTGNLAVKGKSDVLVFNKGDSKLFLKGNVVLFKANKKVIAKQMLYNVDTEDMVIEKRATINFTH